MEKITIDIGVAVYNEAGHIGSVLEMITHQKLANFYIREIIVLNDASTDGTGEIIEKIIAQKSVANLRLINLAVNQGKANGMNIIFGEANADLLCIFDSDIIISDENSLEKWLAPYLAPDKEKVGLACAMSDEKRRGLFDFYYFIYNFGTGLFERISYKFSQHPMFAVGATLSLPKKVYKAIKFPAGIYRSDAFIYMFMKTKGLKLAIVRQPRFQLLREEKFGNFTKLSNLGAFIESQARTNSIPANHIDFFGDIVKEEYKHPPLRILLIAFFQQFLINPIGGIGYFFLKIIAFLAIKVFTYNIFCTWRREPSSSH